MRREHLNGWWALQQEAEIPADRMGERIARDLEHGLASAWSVQDRTIPLFSRYRRSYNNGGTFMAVPFLEDMRQLGGQDVAIVGAPLDGGATYRSGTRFGPMGIRMMSGLASGYNFEFGVDLRESLDIVDCGDVTVIPGNLEKSFDQIDKAMAYVHERAVFPVVLGGDHSIGYPDIRGMAPYIDGNIGIIHFDRHIDMSDRILDERNHGTPFFHATNIANAPASNLVQIGIGGWLGNRSGTKNARAKGATSITIADIDRWGIERTMEVALDLAWKNAKAVFLSFDIDSMDPAFAPGTGTPESGGLLPREAFRMLQMAAREGLAGMEVVEVAPPYDVGDVTSLLGARVVFDVLGTLVQAGKLGRRETTSDREQRLQDAAEQQHATPGDGPA